jgi:hypothetical protein
MDEQHSAISTTLRRLFFHLHDRLESLHREPTLADHNAIQDGIERLPEALPEDGYGVSQTISFVQNTILPALAPGHAGPRFVAGASHTLFVPIN